MQREYQERLLEPAARPTCSIVALECDSQINALQGLIAGYREAMPSLPDLAGLGTHSLPGVRLAASAGTARACCPHPLTLSATLCRHSARQHRRVRRRHQARPAQRRRAGRQAPLGTAWP